jgi:hypothetical protein
MAILSQKASGRNAGKILVWFKERRWGGIELGIACCHRNESPSQVRARCEESDARVDRK